MLRLGTTEDDWAIAEVMARFAADQLAPVAAELDETESSCTRHVPALGELGVMGMNLPVASEVRGCRMRRCCCR